MADVDPLNQFPNSRMAEAVRLGQSRFVSVDTPSTPISSQNNISIAAASSLTVPATAGYAVIQAIGGPLYYTLNGSVPSPTNYAGMLADGTSVTFTGQRALTALRIIGTTMSVGYLQ